MSSTTAAHNVIACIIAFKVHRFTLAMLMIEMCHAHYLAVLLLTNCIQYKAVAAKK